MNSTPQLSLVVGSADDRPGASPNSGVVQGNPTLHIHLHLGGGIAPRPAEPDMQSDATPPAFQRQRRVHWPVLAIGGGFLVITAYVVGGWNAGSTSAPAPGMQPNLPSLALAPLGNVPASPTDEVAHLREQLAMRPTVTIPGRPSLPPAAPVPLPKADAPNLFGLEN